MNKSYDVMFYHDAGHGWMRVRRRWLHELGIEGQISSYSYQNRGGGIVYLEEDCDAGKFIEAAKAAGVEVILDRENYVYHGDYSRIRSYPRYEERRYAQ